MNDRKIEERILPLVKALNDTGRLHTCSSCQGHFESYEQMQQDRNKADVRFNLANNVTDEEIESFLNDLFVEFNRRESFAPVFLRPYKLYIPNGENKRADFVYVIELVPYDRFDHPSKKRKDIDNAINSLTEIVKKMSV